MDRNLLYLGDCSSLDGVLNYHLSLLYTASFHPTKERNYLLSDQEDSMSFALAIHKETIFSGLNWLNGSFLTNSSITNSSTDSKSFLIEKKIDAFIFNAKYKTDHIENPGVYVEV